MKIPAMIITANTLSKLNTSTESKKALKIVKEFQKYRRGEKPYDGETPETHKRFDYSGKPLGEALDSIIKFVDVTISAQEMFAKIGTTTNFCGIVKHEGK